MAVIGIRYNDGGNPLSYKACRLSLSGDKPDVIFDSGDFIQDWYDLIKHVVNSQLDEPVSYSSSVDHFIMDGAPYDSGYLREDENGEYQLYYDHSCKGIEIFVPEGTEPTWKELKEKYGKKEEVK